MDSVSVGVNQLDCFLGFHMDLFTHCDGEVSVLRRDKAANLFSVLQICRQRFREGWRRILLCWIAWWRVCCKVSPLGCYLGGYAPRQDYAEALQEKGNSHGGYQREGHGPCPEGDQGQGPEPGQGRPGGAKILDLGLAGRQGSPSLSQRAATTAATATTTRGRARRRRRILPRILIQVSILNSPPLFHLLKLGIHPFSLLLLYCCLLLWDLLSI